jgi:outer membrane receptor for ferrienterochelin and colicins
VKNLFDSYQDDFDTGPDRDSGYIYGPMMPRNFFVGLKFSF